MPVETKGSERSRRRIVFLSPLGVIALGYSVQRLAGATMGAWASIPTILVFWGTLAALILWDGRDKPPRAWLATPRGSRVWPFLAVAVGLIAVTDFPSGWHVLKSPAVLALWLAFGLLNPWFEEGYWRGLLIDATSHWPKGLGVVYSTALFVLSHPLIWGVNSAALRHPVALAGATLLGAVWSLAYWRTGSLRWAIVGHTCANLFGLALPVLLNLHTPSALR